MKFAVTVVSLPVMASTAAALLRAAPEISSVAIDHGDANVIYLRIEHSPCKAALSTNGGLTFMVIADQNIPTELTTNLSVGARRYVLANANELLRSDDAGLSWKNTAAASFMWDQNKAEAEREQKAFWKWYGPRLPSRSIFWHPLFGLFAGGYFLLTFLALRTQGRLEAICTGLRGLAVLLLVWWLLWIFHAYVSRVIFSQFPNAYWNTSGESNPSPKLCLAMAIAARPFPLLVYLLSLWPLLPGSLSVMGGCACSPTSTRRRVSLVLSVAVGSAFVIFHVCMMFVGHFWQAWYPL